METQEGQHLNRNNDAGVLKSHIFIHFYSFWTIEMWFTFACANHMENTQLGSEDWILSAHIKNNEITIVPANLNICIVD